MVTLPTWAGIVLSGAGVIDVSNLALCRQGSLIGGSLAHMGWNHALRGWGHRCEEPCRHGLG